MKAPEPPPTAAAMETALKQVEIAGKEYTALTAQADAKIAALAVDLASLRDLWGSIDPTLTQAHLWGPAFAARAEESCPRMNLRLDAGLHLRLSDGTTVWPK